LIYQRGWNDIGQNPAEAARRLTEAAGQGNGLAHAMLGQSFLLGEGVKTDNKTAFHHMKMSADMDTPEGLLGLAIIYHQGLGGKQKNLSTAIEYYIKAAEFGNIEAQFQLGMLYFSGKNIPRDYSKSIKYFSMAAFQGYTRAIYYLGWMHHNGLATIESCYKALQMFQIVSQRYNIIEVNELAKSFYIMKLQQEAYYYYTFTSEMVTYYSLFDKLKLLILIFN
jgi:hypothetical protein